MFTVCRLTWKNTFRFRLSGPRQGDSNGIKYESRVESNTRKLVTCWPSMTRKPRFLSLDGWLNDTQVWSRLLVEQGHEIASHGYGHELVTTQTPGAI